MKKKKQYRFIDPHKVIPIEAFYRPEGDPGGQYNHIKTGLVEVKDHDKRRV